MKLSTTATEPVRFTIVRPDRSGYDPGGNVANDVRFVTQDVRGAVLINAQIAAGYALTLRLRYVRHWASG